MTCLGHGAGCSQRANSRIKLRTICEAKDKLVDSIEMPKNFDLQTALMQEPPESLSLETEV